VGRLPATERAPIHFHIGKSRRHRLFELSQDLTFDALARLVELATSLSSTRDAANEVMARAGADTECEGESVS
jgi:hypothetical protein